ncbi:MAG: hypothetical protein WCV50_04480 [Patescibacteria group bacterium]|jgi:hypothetical protein
MPEIIQEKNDNISADNDALIAGKSPSFYWQASRWFALLLVVLEALNIKFDFFKYAEWVIIVAVFAVFAFWLQTRRRISLTAALVAGVFLGVISGLLLAIFDIIWYHQWWYLLNLIRMPFINTAVGAATILVFYLLIQSLKNNKIFKASKGGGNYGGKETNYSKYR